MITRPPILRLMATVASLAAVAIARSQPSGAANRAPLKTADAPPISAQTTLNDQSPSAPAPHRPYLGTPVDDSNPPGCLSIVGKPPPTSCLPCPPLWLGGPSVLCTLRLPNTYRASRQAKVMLCLGVPTMLRPDLRAKMPGLQCSPFEPPPEAPDESSLRLGAAQGYSK